MAEENKNQIIEEGKKALKSAVMKKIKPLLIKVSLPFILIILAGALLLGTFDAIGEAVQKVIQSVVEFFTIDHDGAISIDDSQIDKIINGITDLGVSMDGLKLMGDVDYSNPNIQEEYQEQMRKYIREFYEAQAMTQTLNTKPDWLEDITTSKPYGTVYVHRAIGDTVTPTQGNQLTYISYDEMEKMKKEAESAKPELRSEAILRYFSIDNEGKLVIAGWTETVITEDKTEISNELTVPLYHIEYKNAISHYTTSMNFFLYLAMITQNPEFVSEVVELVKKSDIRLTIMDIESTNIVTEKYTYTENTKVASKESSQQYDAWDTEKLHPYTVWTLEIGDTISKDKTKVVTTTRKEKNPEVSVTYAKTWFGEQTVTYNKEEDEPTNIIGKPMNNGEDDEEPKVTGEGTYTWITNRKVQYDTNTTGTRYKEGTREDVKDLTGHVGDGKNSFIGLLDEEFKIPNSTRKVTAGGNLVSGAQMMLYLLQKDPNAQNLEQLMRYILNKYENEKNNGNGSNRYGDISFDDISNQFSIRMLTTGSNFIVNTSMSASELCITDENILKEAIEKIYDGEMKKNLVSEANNFIIMQSKYHVNAVFAMAVTIVESSAGTNWAAIDSSTYNWYSITGSYNGNTYRNPNSGNSRTWRVYPNFREATFDFGNLIANSSYYFKAEKYTVEEIAETYCSTEWGKSVISVMNEIYAAAGIELPTQGFMTGGVTTDEGAKKLQTYIETNLIHTQYHIGNSLYQNGPFAQWWTVGYNNLSPFQCTWWANGRASMYLEQYGTVYKKYPTQSGNGGDYYQVNKNNGWFKYGNIPKPNSIISWKKGNSYGHVAYVEGVSADGIYISHAGSGKSWLGIQKIPLNGSIWSGYTLNGYIYLDEPN